MPAPTFEEMMDSATKSKPSSSADSNDPEGLTVTKSRPSSPAVSDHSEGLNAAEFKALADSLDETSDPTCDPFEEGRTGSERGHTKAGRQRLGSQRKFSLPPSPSSLLDHCSFTCRTRVRRY